MVDFSILLLKHSITMAVVVACYHYWSRHHQHYVLIKNFTVCLGSYFYRSLIIVTTTKLPDTNLREFWQYITPESKLCRVKGWDI